QAPRPGRRRRRPAQPPAAVRFSVLQSGLPPETDALVYTDLLRQAALHHLPGQREERQRTLLGGRTADDQAMAGHQHAHYLPVLADRRLAGLVVWTPGGLPEDEVKALTSVRQLFSPANESWRLTVRVAGMGTVTDAAPEFARASRTWRSATPFTPSRYPKRNADWPAFLHQEIARELRQRDLPPPVRVAIMEGDWVAWRRYRPSARLRRDRGQGQANRPSAFLRLEFDDPVRGPLALGHLSHFGLGLFAPET
ncbi:MAG: type I-G CRISPR-associated protein Csb2, partial [Pseudonocardiaceae bacterium]